MSLFDSTVTRSVSTLIRWILDSLTHSKSEFFFLIGKSIKYVRVVEYYIIIPKMDEDRQRGSTLVVHRMVNRN